MALDNLLAQLDASLASLPVTCAPVDGVVKSLKEGLRSFQDAYVDARRPLRGSAHDGETLEAFKAFEKIAYTQIRAMQDIQHKVNHTAKFVVESVSAIREEVRKAINNA